MHVENWLLLLGFDSNLGNKRLSADSRLGQTSLANGLASPFGSFVLCALLTRPARAPLFELVASHCSDRLALLALVVQFYSRLVRRHSWSDALSAAFAARCSSHSSVLCVLACKQSYALFYMFYSIEFCFIGPLLMRAQVFAHLLYPTVRICARLPTMRSSVLSVRCFILSNNLIALLWDSLSVKMFESTCVSKNRLFTIWFRISAFLSALKSFYPSNKFSRPFLLSVTNSVQEISADARSHQQAL